MAHLWDGLKNRIRCFTNMYPIRVQCNLCFWKGRALLSDSWHPHTICPKCGSQIRHRLMVAAMNSFEKLSTDSLVNNRRVLHFAPEPILTTLLKSNSDRYITADFMRDDVDLELDMCDMRVLEDGSFDLIVACDVLEHVLDDSQAMKELFRVLSLKGWVILTVPQKDALAETFEDKSITSDAGRLEAFGQEDHLRIYGDNFPEILEPHGFAVTTIDANSFKDEAVKKNVLFPPQLSSNPLATNFRKVFFAQKPLSDILTVELPDSP